MDFQALRSREKPIRRFRPLIGLNVSVKTVVIMTKTLRESSLESLSKYIKIHLNVNDFQLMSVGL